MSSVSDQKPNVLFLNSCVSGGGAGRSLLAYLGLDSPKVNPHIVLPEPGIIKKHLKHKERLHYIKEFIERPLTPPYKWVGSIPVLNALAGVWSLIISAFKIGNLAKSLRINVIYCNHMLANPVGVVLGMLLQIPVIFHIRNIHNNFWIERWFYRWMAKAPAVKSLICNSNASAEPFRDIMDDKITVVHNFCDLSMFNRKEIKPALRKELGLDEKTKIIGYVGRITGWKGIDLLIRSFAEVVKEEPMSTLVIVGENDGGIKKDLKKLYKELAEELGVREKTYFIGFKDDIRPYVIDFDVLALPSRAPEPFGRVLVESMALGVPAVIAAHGGAVEVVENDQDGLWSEPRNPFDMARKLVRVLEDDGFRKQLAGQAAISSRLKFDDHFLAQRITQVIYRTANSGSAEFQSTVQTVPSFG